MGNCKKQKNIDFNLKFNIENIKKSLSDPKIGLPQELFYFVSELTPMINLDLLIKDPLKGTLLTWRQDQFYGPAWHIPGGIIRFKESIETRIKKVAKAELGIDQIRFHPSPIFVSEKMNPNRNVRGHFISLLYLCEIFNEPCKELQYNSEQIRPGDWQWHSVCPENILSVHDSFKVFINQSAEEILCTRS